jgi:guanine deaminase
MKPDTRPIGIRGFLIDAPEYGTLRAIRDGALLIEEGCITAYDSFEAVQANHEGRDIRWRHSPEAVVIPGLVDLHTHLPQYPAVTRPSGTRQGTILENQFRVPIARVQSRAFFEDLIRHGTTSAVVHAATLATSTETAFSAAEECGLRITMGKLMRDRARPEDPPPEASAERSCAESEALCRKWHGRDAGRLEYVFSPQSLLTCTEPLFRQVVGLANQHNARIQTHHSEFPGEAESVRTLHPNPSGSVGFYADCGLLGKQTLLAPCARLTAEEIDSLAASGAAVAHCPTADFQRARGLLPLDRLRHAGVRIGLGSDVAGGSELNLWQVMRSVITTQTARHYSDETLSIPSPAEALHLATQGGADALGKGSLIGSLDIGREADLVVLDLAALTPYGRKLNPHAHLDAADIISLLVYRGGSQAVIETFVRGRSLHRAAAPLLV